ncbi:hypothetical protein KQX54_008667 [Cotesia glomerata]|uniref:Uncharacterized protein n=1 Tax=Cotesia glomerata TaxID=32391 RepID=A0AAV7IQI4_COTGL|nr:hypothetical protein KQX54_008667 [Cotesia glomerata]
MTKSKKRSRSNDREDDTNKRLRRLEKMMELFLDLQNVTSKKDDGHSNKENVPNNPKDHATVNTGLTNPVEESEKSDPQQTEEAVSDPTKTVTPVVDYTKQVESTSEVTKLDEELEGVLGEDPTNPKKKVVNVHPSLVPRWSTWLTEGLPEDTKKELKDKYPLNGTLLYGETLSEKIKTAKSVEKIGRELKTPSAATSSFVAKKPAQKLASGRPLNWRGQYARMGTQHQGQKFSQTNYPKAGQYTSKKTSSSSSQQLRSSRLSQGDKKK